MVSTATNIGRDKDDQGTFFLTCEHGHGAGHDGISLTNSHYAELWNARYRIVKIAGTKSQARDVAIFFLWDRDIPPSILAKVKAECFPIAQSVSIGDSIHRIGFPKNLKSWRRVDGRLLSLTDFSKPGMSGESGGPYLNTHREVVGVNRTTDPATGTSGLTSLAQIRSFLQETIKGIPLCKKPDREAPFLPKEDLPKPEPKPMDPSPGTKALLKQIAALEARLKKLESQGPLSLELLFYNSKNAVVARGVLKDGSIKMILSDNIIQTTKADGRTVVDEQKFPAGTPIRLRSTIKIEALKRALKLERD